LFCSSYAKFFFFSLVAKTQLNHWTKRVVSTQLIICWGFHDHSRHTANPPYIRMVRSTRPRFLVVGVFFYFFGCYAATQLALEFGEPLEKYCLSGQSLNLLREDSECDVCPVQQNTQIQKETHGTPPLW